MDIMIETRNLSKTFKLSGKQQKLERTKEKTKIAVDNLSFTAVKGEIFGLLGPNGAGKTTTLRMLATLIRPENGDAIVDGASIITEPEKVRGKIGFLTSELRLEDFFTPSYMFDFFADIHSIPEKEKEVRKKDLFEKFGVGDFAEVKIANLSTGMKQKVSLMISVIHNPNIIIFDEPTNGLDVITAKTVTDFLLEMKAQGKTILLSTHIFSLVEKICDRAGIIIGGKMVGCDTIAALTAEKNLEDTFFDLYSQVMEVI